MRNNGIVTVFFVEVIMQWNIFRKKRWKIMIFIIREYNQNCLKKGEKIRLQNSRDKRHALTKHDRSHIAKMWSLFFVLLLYNIFERNYVLIYFVDIAIFTLFVEKFLLLLLLVLLDWLQVDEVIPSCLST